MKPEILNTLLKNRLGQKIKIETNRGTTEGKLDYVDSNCNILLKNEQGHSVFIQRCWINSVEFLEGDKHD